MKQLRITLGVAAIAIGSFAAFSFAPATEAKVALQEFYVNPVNGTRGDAVGDDNECDNSTQAICSAEYDTSTNQQTGNNIHKGVRQP